MDRKHHDDTMDEFNFVIYAVILYKERITIARDREWLEIGQSLETFSDMYHTSGG